MKTRNFVLLFLVGLLTQVPSARALSSFAYVCIQPGDQIYSTVPAIDWDASLGKLEGEYQALFTVTLGNPSLVSFKPLPRLEVLLSAEDYDGEVKFDRVRFLVAEGKLYTWIGYTGAGAAHQGVVWITPSIRIDGKEIVHGRKITVEMRPDLRNCNS